MSKEVYIRAKDVWRAFDEYLPPHETQEQSNKYSDVLFFMFKTRDHIRNYGHIVEIEESDFDIIDVFERNQREWEEYKRKLKQNGEWRE